MNNQDPNVPQGLDPTAFYLTKAIKKAETGTSTDPYNTKGASGEFGAYQYTPDTWKVQAQKFLGDANAPMSEENQNKVAYSNVKSLLDQGYTQSQVASIHNSGNPDANATGTGVNKFGVHYDVPGYVNKVKENYLSLMGQSTQDNTQQNNGYVTASQVPPQTPQNALGMQDNTQPDSSLGTQIAGDITEAGKGVSQISNSVNDILTGKKNIGQGLLGVGGGLLHTFGSAAKGLIGDPGTALAEQVPGVKSLENFIGEKASNYFQTPGGQAIIKSLQDFQKQNPGMSQAGGDVFNIATSIPILKGLGAVKDIVLDTASQALKKQAEKVATNELTNTISSTVGGRRAIDNSPDAIKTLINERAIPDIQNGKYSTQEASDLLEQKISDIDHNELQAELSKNNLNNIASRKPLEDYKKIAMSEAVDQLHSTAPVEDYFKRIQAKYGDYPTLQQMNDAKRQVANNISQAGFASPTASTDKIVRSALQQGVEDGAKTLGLKNVNEINKKMANLIKAQKMLSHIEGKSVKLGELGKTIQLGATAGGAALGTGLGLSPEVGGYLSNRFSGLIGKNIKGVVPGILKRTEPGAYKKGLVTSLKKIDKGTQYGVLQGQTNKGAKKVSQ